MITNNVSTIRFDSLDEKKWISTIASIINNYEEAAYKKSILLAFNSKLKSEKFETVHLVTLACLIQFFHQKGYSLAIYSVNQSTHDMLFTDLRFKEYWSGGKNHVDCTDNNIFNLWRIVETEQDLYAKNVEKYFKNNIFKGKDLSVISLSLIEAFYNISDHADAGGNAFSIIKYDSEKETLHVAICDFGKGIARSVRDFNPAITSDKDALLKSIEIDFTIRSKAHNRGKGLDNILSCSSAVRIFSNNALLLKNDYGVKKYDSDVHFGGTLIYFQIQLSSTEDEEILDEFELY